MKQALDTMTGGMARELIDDSTKELLSFAVTSAYCPQFNEVWTQESVENMRNYLRSVNPSDMATRPANEQLAHIDKVLSFMNHTQNQLGLFQPLAEQTQEIRLFESLDEELSS